MLLLSPSSDTSLYASGASVVSVIGATCVFKSLVDTPVGPWVMKKKMPNSMMTIAKIRSSIFIFMYQSYHIVVQYVYAWNYYHILWWGEWCNGK